LKTAIGMRSDLDLAVFMSRKTIHDSVKIGESGCWEVRTRNALAGFVVTPAQSIPPGKKKCLNFIQIQRQPSNNYSLYSVICFQSFWC